MEKVQEEKKDKLSELLQKAQKQISSLEDNFNYIDSQSINNPKLENYTPYTDLAGPRDSVFNRFLWLNNQEDRGEIFYLTKKFAYYQKMVDYYASKLGDIKEHRDVYFHCSPIYKVANVNTPVFLVHGEGRYPRSDASLKFARALEREYKIYEYKIYPNECYYVITVPNLLEMYPDIVDFMNRYLK